MVRRVGAGTYEFCIHLPYASNVELAGDFTGWDHPLAMIRDEDGWWSVRASVPAGDHEFVYFVNGGARMPDYAADGVRFDSAGRLISLLTVAPAQRPPEPSAGAATPERHASTSEPRAHRRTAPAAPARSETSARSAR